MNVSDNALDDSCADPFDFPSSLGRKIPELKQIYDELQCKICYELCRDPVITRCSHNFCSICVRKYLLHKQACPHCHEEVHENHLRINRTVSEIQNAFVAAIPKICNILRAPTSGTPRNGSICDTDIIETLPSKITTPSEKKKGSKRSATTTESIPSTSSQSVASRPEQNAFESTPSTSTIVMKGELPCPVCGVPVPEKNINIHLDKCLQNDQLKKPEASATTTVQTSSKNSLKPLQKIVYHLLKESDLRKKCKEEGLDTKGDRKTLIARHQRFSVLWNANCERDKPLSRLQIVMKVQKEEKREAKSKEETQSLSTSLLDYDRKSDVKVIDEKRKEYMKQNKSEFDKLIAQMKNRRNKRKSEETKEVVDVECDVEINKSISTEDLSISEDSSTQDDECKVTKVIVTPKKSKDDTKNPLDWLLNTSSDVSANDTTLVESDNDIFEAESPAPQPPRISSQLYITPKRRRLDDQTPESSKRFRQNTISSLVEKSAERQSSLAKAPCPNCGNEIPLKHINLHLDRCLGKAEARSHKDDEDVVIVPKPIRKKRSLRRILDEDSSQEVGENAAQTVVTEAVIEETDEPVGRKKRNNRQTKKGGRGKRTAGIPSKQKANEDNDFQ